MALLKRESNGFLLKQGDHMFKQRTCDGWFKIQRANSIFFRNKVFYDLTSASVKTDAGQRRQPRSTRKPTQIMLT